MIDFKNKNILVVAAHPDDEILGCGGTIAKAREAGATVSFLILGEGPTSRATAQDDKTKSEAIIAARNAADILDVTNIFFGSFPDNRFDSLPLLDLIKFIEQVAQEVQPDIVFTHHYGDLNIDHSYTHRATMTAFRPLPDHKPLTLLGFEVLSSTEYSPPNSLPQFSPNVFINIENFIEKKQLALKAYDSEICEWPHPRSTETTRHLAQLRGAHSGCKAAEAFILYRTIN